MRWWLLAGALLAVSCARCRSGGLVDAGPDRAWLAGLPERDSGTPRSGGALVIRAMVEPSTLNGLEGRTSRETWTFRITRNLVTESLLTVDPQTMQVVPQLAERWSDSADHRVTTFWLRRDRRFHDETPLTAKDVVATLAAVLDESRPTGAARQDLGSLGGVRAIDEWTVEVTWKTPSPFALRQLARLPILQAKQLQGDWTVLAKAPVGTGPCRVGAWEKGQSLTLERVGDGAFVDRLVFRFVKDHTLAQAMLERGEFDVMTSVQPVLWRAMETPEPRNAWAQRDYRRLVAVDNSYSYIAWNQARPQFRDVKVRRALAHLYPAALVEQTIDLGLETPTTCPWWSLGPQCDPSVQPLAWSPDAARGLLADAGYVDADGDGVLEHDGVPLRFTFLLPATSVRLGKLAPLMQEQARQVGIEWTLETVDVATLGSRINARDFDVVSRVWTESDLESDQFGTFHSSARDGGSNFVGYVSPEADALMEQIRAEWDEPKRRALERALHRRLYADQPYLFMTTRRSLDLAKRRVHGLEPSLLWYDLRRVWVDP